MGGTLFAVLFASVKKFVKIISEFAEQHFVASGNFQLITLTMIRKNPLAK